MLIARSGKQTWLEKIRVGSGSANLDRNVRNVPSLSSVSHATMGIHSCFMRLSATKRPGRMTFRSICFAET